MIAIHHITQRLGLFLGGGQIIKVFSYVSIKPLSGVGEKGNPAKTSCICLQQEWSGLPFWLSKSIFELGQVGLTDAISQ